MIFDCFYLYTIQYEYANDLKRLRKKFFFILTAYQEGCIGRGLLFIPFSGMATFVDFFKVGDADFSVYLGCG